MTKKENKNDYKNIKLEDKELTAGHLDWKCKARTYRIIQKQPTAQHTATYKTDHLTK
jgi:hypothetical protein